MRLSRISIMALVCSSAAARSLSAAPEAVLNDKDQNPHEWQPKQWNDPIDAMVHAFNKPVYFESAAERHPNESWRGHGKRKKKHLKEINKY